MNGSKANGWGHLRTYKRRKRPNSTSHSQPQQNQHPTAQSLPEWSNLLLEHLFHSLTGNQDGIRADFQNPFVKTECDSCIDDGRHKSSSHGAWTPNGTSCGNERDFTWKCNGATNSPCVTEICHNVFLSVVLSDKFNSLCKLLYENFQGVNVDNLFSLNLINKRMKEGTYEHSPFLFSDDIQQLWRKIQAIGTELTSIAKSLLVLSTTCYNQQFQLRGTLHGASADEKHECCSRESDSHDKFEQKGAGDIYSCRHCGDRACGRDCLVCDSCEEMYHVSCIKPAVKEMPPKSWFCASCTARGVGSPHDSCAVCERLNASRPSLNEATDQINSMNEVAMFNECEETSNYNTSGGFRRENACICKICGSEVNNGEKLKICDHDFCPNKHYHVRCLTVKQLNSYGPRWYCPSCLCRACRTDKDDDKIVLCDSCDHAYHIYCMTPPQSSVPNGNWFCSKCDSKIQELRRIKRAYEKYENTVKGNLGAVNQQCTKNLGRKGVQRQNKDREGMDILLTAALAAE